MADVRAAWGGYAASFAAEEADVQNRPPMQRLIERCALPAGAAVLDVATGAGFTAFAFASTGCRVVASDPTHEMLLAAREGWRRRGLDGDVVLVECWAEGLPFREGVFDAVVSHRAPHQFADQLGFLREARRVVHRGGVVGVADQSPPDGWERWHNDLERLRDPTHERALSLREWRGLADVAGLEWVSGEIVGQPHDAETWCDRVGATGERRTEIMRRIEHMPDELRGIYRPERRDGRLVFDGPQCVFVARNG